MDLKPFSPFRAWVHNLWVQNCEERQFYKDGPQLNVVEYFKEFKWWLRREYRYQREKELDKRRKRTI